MQVLLYRSSSAALFKNSLQTLRHHLLLQASFVEEEIDRMNESFLRLSVELQNRTRPSPEPREGDGSNHLAVISSNHCMYNQCQQFVFVILSHANFHCCPKTINCPRLFLPPDEATALPSAIHHPQQAAAESVPGPRRNGTILLEVRRRRVAQRLDELGITLGQIRGCQRRGSRSRDGAGGRAYAHVDGGRPSSGRGLDGIPASRGRGQKCVTGESLGKRDSESGTCPRGEGDDLESSGVRRTESDMDLRGSGQREGTSRIPVENTSGETDMDAMQVAEDQQLPRR